jgi:hypothetical protein
MVLGTGRGLRYGDMLAIYNRSAILLFDNDRLIALVRWRFVFLGDDVLAFRPSSFPPVVERSSDLAQPN